MKINITKRDIKLFVIGIMTAFLVLFVWDLENNIQSFKDGFNAGYSKATQVETGE